MKTLGLLSALAALAILTTADPAFAGQSLSGRNLSQRGPSTPQCLCGTGAFAIGGRCFVDSLCADAPDCGPLGACASGRVCIDDNCCGVPKCVVACSLAPTCTVQSGRGICDAYDQCSAGSSQCNFNVANALNLRASMVRSAAPCPGAEHPIPNTLTEGGTAACSPPTPAQVLGQGTPYLYSAKGACTVKARAKLVKNCALVTDAGKSPLGLPSGPCHVTYVDAKCSGIVQGDETTPIGADDAGWSLATVVRATLDTGDGPAMTVIDFPLHFQFSTPSKGAMALRSSSAEALVGMVGAAAAALPPCTSFEIVRLVINDPNGLPFAVPGVSTAPL